MKCIFTSLKWHILKKISRIVSTEKSVKTHMAVRFVALLLKRSFVELLQAETAHKALRVKLPEHGGDAATLNGSVTIGADPGAEQRAGTGLAVRLAISLPEVPRTQLHSTAGAAEEVQAPSAAHSSDGLGLYGCLLV